MKRSIIIIAGLLLMACTSFTLVKNGTGKAKSVTCCEKQSIPACGEKKAPASTPLFPVVNFF